MIANIDEAKSALETDGLIVANGYKGALLIGGRVKDGGDGVRVFKDACGLNPRDGEWIVLFPAEGLCQFEVPRPLPEAVELILAAYRDHRKNGGQFSDACRRVLKDADQYLIGRSLARV